MNDSPALKFLIGAAVVYIVGRLIIRDINKAYPAESASNVIVAGVRG